MPSTVAVSLRTNTATSVAWSAERRAWDGTTTADTDSAGIERAMENPRRRCCRKAASTVALRMTRLRRTKILPLPDVIIVVVVMVVVVEVVVEVVVVEEKATVVFVFGALLALSVVVKVALDVVAAVLAVEIVAAGDVLPVAVAAVAVGVAAVVLVRQKSSPR